MLPLLTLMPSVSSHRHHHNHNRWRYHYSLLNRMIIRSSSITIDTICTSFSYSSLSKLDILVFRTMNKRWFEIWPAAPDTATLMVFFHPLVRLLGSCRPQRSIYSADLRPEVRLAISSITLELLEQRHYTNSQLTLSIL
jgi:hypothetical protein